MSISKKPWPTLPSDEASDAFVEMADLSDYDWSAAESARYEFEDEPVRVSMSVPKTQLAAIKSEAKRRGIRYQLFMQELLEQGLRSLR